MISIYYTIPDLPPDVDAPQLPSKAAFDDRFKELSFVTSSGTDFIVSFKSFDGSFKAVLFTMQTIATLFKSRK